MAATKEASAPGAPAPGRTKWTKARAREFLRSCPKRTAFIERTADDIRAEGTTGQSVYQYIGWNGWSWPVPKGKPVEVPEPIAQIIEQSQQRLRTAQARESRAFFNEIGDGPGVELAGDAGPGTDWSGR